MPAAPTMLFGPVPHQEAADFIASKPVVSREVFNGLLPELRARAFLITGVEGANVLQAVRDRIAELPAGANWDDVKKDVVDDISPFLVDPNADPEHRDGQINAANRRADLLLRTHGFQAYQAAAYQVMDRQRDVLPYWQYLTMEDDRVRPEHAALDQVVLPQDHPFWQHHYPPWDFGCRCQVVPISQEDRDEIAAKDSKRPPDAKLVLEGPLADQLTHGRIVRDARTYDVRPPTQRDGSSGFSWNPGDLRIPLSALKARYDGPVWSQFEMWARATPLEASGSRRTATVWDWLNRTLQPEPAPAAPAPGALSDREKQLVRGLLERVERAPAFHAVFLNSSTNEIIEEGYFNSANMDRDHRARVKRMKPDTLLIAGNSPILPNSGQLTRYADTGVDKLRLVQPDGSIIVVSGLQSFTAADKRRLTTLMSRQPPHDAVAYAAALRETSLKVEEIETNFREEMRRAEEARIAALPVLKVDLKNVPPVPVINRKPKGWLGEGMAYRPADFLAVGLHCPQSSDFLLAWNKHFRISPRKFVDHLTQGLDLDMKQTAISVSGGPTAFALSIEGRLASGAAIHVTRDINFSSMHVHHSYFTISGNNQGKDTGKQLFRNLAGFYDHWGIKDVSVHANIDVGGYAWIRYGFLPENASQLKSLLADATVTWEKLKKANKFDPAAVAVVEGLLKSKDLASIRQLADIRTIIPGGKDQTLGKRLFLGSNWYGRIDLTDPKHFSVFANYIQYS